MSVIKRDGRVEAFNVEKIVNAARKAYEACNSELSSDVENKLRNLFTDKDTIGIEEIQDAVERILMQDNPEFAKAFIIYRYKHQESRLARDRIDYITKYSESIDNASSSSETDANANVTMKNVANLEGEIYKTKNRVIQRQRIKDYLKKLYPEVAKQYETDLENHIIYTHDEASSPVPKPYCMAGSLYPLMMDGVGNIDGVTPCAPNDIQSYSGQVTNLTFLLSSQVKGAVALGEYLIALNYYVIQEFGEDWYTKLDDLISSSAWLKKVTVKDYIRKGMKTFIYGVNQPAGNRCYNSPFSNISYYDKTYFNSLFEDFYYPDGTQPQWKAIDAIQRIFMELHRELRLIKPLTFPVTTMAMVHDGTDVIDKEYKKLCAEEWAKGGSFFCYLSDNPSSLASCCFSKDTKFLWKSSTNGVQLTTFEEFNKLPYKGVKENFKVFHNGSWVSGKVITLPNRTMYEVSTYNNKKYIMSDNHINVTISGEKQTKDLTTEDYLMFNTLALQAIPENDLHLTYEQGFVVGSFIGDGSFGASIKNTIYQLEISQNEKKYKKTMQMFDIANSQLGNANKCTLKAIVNNKYPVSICSKELASFIKYWTNWERGVTASTKTLNLDCLLQSIEFRKGILDGWYHTDGGNSNRCYTTSKILAENMEVLITSLGMNSIIDVSDRTSEKVIIRGEEYNRNYPLYCVRWYENKNHRVNKDVNKSWIKRNNSIYFKIKDIRPIEYNDNIYCIECEDSSEPYFTLPSGLITHNCRVLNEIQDNTFSSINGLQGIMTGSCNVITLNLNRIIQDWWESIRTKEYHLIPGKPEVRYAKEPINILEYEKGTLDNLLQSLSDYLKTILERVYKYHIAYKTILYDLEDKGMFASSNAKYIYIKKLYSTIGIIGYCEAAQFLGLEISNNEDYKNFLAFVFNTIKEQNKLHSIRDKKRPFLFNSEAIPGESLAVKLYNWDKEDGYYVPENQNLYSSYFFLQWDNNISVLDKLRLHGKYINAATDGGQACHINLNEHLTETQYSKIIDFCIKEGVNYWTFNIPMSECKECGHTVNAPIKKCPLCGSTKIDWWTRIIGYLRPVSAWSNPRQLEFSDRIFSERKNVEI